MSVAMTTYRVEDSLGNVDYITDADEAERLSFCGYTVTAITEKPL